MPIKKSVLEKKWYYRISKVFFLIAPLLVGAYLFFEKKLNPLYVGGGLIAYYILLKIIWRLSLYVIFGGLENDIPNKSNAVAPPIATAGVQPTHGNSIGPIIVIIIIIILVALFINGNIKLPEGLLENTSSPTESTKQYGTVCDGKNGKGLYGTDGHCYSCSKGIETTNPAGNCSNGTAGIYCCETSSNSNTNTNNTSGRCVPTGCGNYWYCSGYYYMEGKQIKVNGCLPYPAGQIYSGWSGTCRQCP